VSDFNFFSKPTPEQSEQIQARLKTDEDYYILGVPKGYPVDEIRVIITNNAPTQIYTRAGAVWTNRYTAVPPTKPTSSD
jgi:hypothetical protein